MKLRNYVAVFLAVAALALAPTAANAGGNGKGGGGSNQQCSQRGGSRNEVKIVCVVPTVSLGDVTVNIKSAELFSDNDLNVTVEFVKNQVDVVNISDVDLLAGNTLTFLNVTVGKNVTQVCVTALGKSGCKAKG